jgi:ribonuclease BN (tRNA processing enzyme)
LPEFFDVHDSPAVAARLKRYHSTPEQTGADAQEAGVKLLVLTHLVPGNVPEGHDNAFLQRARKTFRGKIIVGRDLMKF